jgi:DHA2 family multidrug resistance protein
MSGTGTVTAGAAPDRGAPFKWIIALALMLGTFMEVLDTSVANVALPHMKGTYAAGTDEITWVLTSYLVANAIVLPITGWLGNYFGRKRLYLTCLTGFTLASLAAGAAPTLGLLITARVIQGLTGGAMVPMSQAITMEAFPKREQGIATAVFGIGVICGPIVGPLVGGWVTDNWSWPWIFWINIPVGILSYALASAFVEESEDRTPQGRMDYLSLIFIAVGLGCLELFLNRGERLDWFESNTVKFYAAASVLGITLFLWRSFTAERPLVDLRMFKLPEYASGMFLIFGASFGMYAAFVMLPLFVQTFLGWTPTWAGIMLSPGGVASVVAMMIAGLAMGKTDVRYTVAAGFLAQIYSSWLLMSINLHSGMGYLIYAWCFRGLGLGFVFVPIATVAMRRIPPESMGVAAGFFNLMRNEGGSVGIAVAATLLQTRSQFHHARLTEHMTAFNPVLQQGAHRLSAAMGLVSGQDAGTSAQLATGLLGGEVLRQSYVMAFVDVFAFLVLVYVICLPFVLLLKDPGHGEGGIHIH